MKIMRGRIYFAILLSPRFTARNDILNDSVFAFFGYRNLNLIRREGDNCANSSLPKAVIQRWRNDIGSMAGFASELVAVLKRNGWLILVGIRT
ncbi:MULTISPECIES: hypothetical protein [Methylomonas]|uniref:hypothetical protein n=1 Tax=Methylomonas TaxID=416 RepID=UPI0012F6B1C1|nr:hypothetical protein [Methylomonas koyamae]